MRSKLTNILQIFLLITGLVFILLGIGFYISPIKSSNIFGVTVVHEWFNQIKFDSFTAPLYFLVRAFAGLLFTSGLAMILPLYDPLKYRGLVYFNGCLFPLMASLVLIINGLKYNHSILILLGIVFAVVLVLNALGLAITRGQARHGEE